ncbi:MAG: hypothetical protein HC876_06680 [Chloroflexaceae bacterium]|nr:hypothetical protein [Chloroflexaceae bacterium]NJO05220.1 hypothetical protein [Chloroflexaceae bacterium]
MKGRRSASGKQQWKHQQHRRFQAGEPGDDIDMVKWSVLYELHQALQQRLGVLQLAAA